MRDGRPGRLLRRHAAGEPEHDGVPDGQGQLPRFAGPGPDQQLHGLLDRCLVSRKPLFYIYSVLFYLAFPVWSSLVWSGLLSLLFYSVSALLYLCSALLRIGKV